MRAKTKALINIFSFLKQSTTSCNAKLWRQQQRPKNNNIGLIFRNFTHAAHFFYKFLCHQFAQLQKETSRSFLYLHVLWRKCRKYSRSPFFTAAHFSPWRPLAFLIFSPPLQNFHIVLPTRFVSFVFLSLTPALCPSFSSWASLACCLLSPFLCLNLFLCIPNLWTWQSLVCSHVTRQPCWKTIQQDFFGGIYMKIEERNAFVVVIQHVIDCIHIKRP